MAGISDLPFRMINRSFGCEFAFSEMISAQSLVHNSKKTMRMISTEKGDKPIGVQLLGNDPLILGAAMEAVEKHDFDVIDFNAACPVNKVTSRGEGAGLLREPRKLLELLRGMVIRSKVPVTLKIRAGWDENSVNAREAALYAQDAGIAAVTIHGRTRMQGYRGTVDYTVIREVKKALSIPVIGSGDALSPQAIKMMFDETGCDGVAIARGSLGNPWIFRQTSEFLEHNATPRRPGLEELVATMISHLASCCNFYGKQVGNMIFRKFFLWYTRGIPGVKPLRRKALRCVTDEEMAAVIHDLLCVHPDALYEEGRHAENSTIDYGTALS
jgi:tRNA-dihydrouridine synthase B